MYIQISRLSHTQIFFYYIHILFFSIIHAFFFLSLLYTYFPFLLIQCPFSLTHGFLFLFHFKVFLSLVHWFSLSYADFPSYPLKYIPLSLVYWFSILSYANTCPSLFYLFISYLMLTRPLFYLFLFSVYLFALSPFRSDKDDGPLALGNRATWH